MQPEPIQTEQPAVTNGASRASSSSDAFVDSALDALGDLAGPAENTNGKAATKPRTEEQGPGAEDGDAEEEQSLPGAGDGEDDNEHDEEAGEDGEPHDTRGSRENPLSAKDLRGNDIHVEVKVDGKKEVVTLAEALDGYVGQKTIHQRLNQAKALTDEVTQLQAKVREEKQQVVQAVREVLGSADQLYDYFMASDEREQVLYELARRYAGINKKFRENPQERVAFQRQRDLAQIEARRQHLENERRQELEARQQKEAHERAMSIFKPGWETGLKKAGFPHMDARQQQELLQEVMVRCEQRQRGGQAVTSDDVAEFVVRAARLLELPPKGAKKPRPAPVAPPKERESARRGKDPWADKTRRQRVASPDFFLKDLKPRDFR